MKERKIIGEISSFLALVPLAMPNLLSPYDRYGICWRIQGQQRVFSPIQEEQTMLDNQSLLVNGVAFVLAAVLIAAAGSRLAGLADTIADRTGLGEALTGTIFLGLVTALPGLAASVFAAVDDRPALAISNAVGGIAMQTTFLALADIAYKKANLEHAAASATNMMQTAILVVLLVLILLGMASPAVTLGHIHPVTMLLILAAGLGFFMAFRTTAMPMWHPRTTSDTVLDMPDDVQASETLPVMLTKFVLAAVVITIAGTVVADTTGTIADRTGMSETIAGGFLSGIATSLPELVTTIAAVRRGALTLAVGNIVGGNFFDALFVAAADISFVSGSVYHAAGVGASEEFLTIIAILLNLVLLLGLLFRQRSGPANIGLESMLMLIIYAVGFSVLLGFSWD